MDRSSSAFSVITKSEERAGEKVERNGYGHPWKIERASFEVFLCFSKSPVERRSRKKEALKSKVGWVSDCLSLLTFPLSTRFVIITMVLTRCSQTMRQKESKVFVSGPCVATYALAF